MHPEFSNQNISVVFVFPVKDKKFIDTQCNSVNKLISSFWLIVILSKSEKVSRSIQFN